MEDVLVGLAGGSFPEGAICTGWVIVSEWMDAEGQFWTYTAVDDRNPPWRHQGLLNYVLEAGSYDPDDDEDDDDEDDA